MDRELMRGDMPLGSVNSQTRPFFLEKPFWVTAHVATHGVWWERVLHASTIPYAASRGQERKEGAGGRLTEVAGLFKILFVR